MKNEYLFPVGNAKKNVLGQHDDDFKYEVSKIDLNDNNDSHSIIINNVLSKIKKKAYILDVGCNTGAIGIELSKNGFVIDGIEYSKTCCEILKKKNVYKNIYNTSIEDINSRVYKEFENNDTNYDCIILADVLEHLVNPDRVIYNLSKKLSNDGFMIISLPNIAHIDIIEKLLDGNWNYNKTGLLDNTHLRFFTYNSFIDMIDNIEEENNINYNVKVVGKTKIMPDYVRNNDFIKEVLSEKEINDLIVIQNIIILSVTNKKQKRPYKAYNNYNKINNYIENKNMIIDQLNSRIADLENLNKNKDETITSIINSKWWKLRKYFLFWKK